MRYTKKTEELILTRREASIICNYFDEMPTRECMKLSKDLKDVMEEFDDLLIVTSLKP